MHDYKEIWTPNQFNHVFLTLREKDIPNWCIMATPHYNDSGQKKGYFIYWTNVSKMDDSADKSEYLSVQETKEKYKPLQTSEPDLPYKRIRVKWTKGEDGKWFRKQLPLPQ